MSLRGVATFDESGEQLNQLKLAHLSFNQTALKDVVVTRSWARATTSRSPPVLSMPNPSIAVNGDGAKEEAEADPRRGATFRVSAAGSDDHALRAPAVSCRSVELGLERLSDGWNRIQITGAVPKHAVETQTRHGGPRQRR